MRLKNHLTSPSCLEAYDFPLFDFNTQYLSKTQFLNIDARVRARACACVHVSARVSPDMD